MGRANNSFTSYVGHAEETIDEGRLSDASGLIVDFTNTIIIATSNAVTTFISQQLKQNKKLEEIQTEIFNELLNTFRIEFLNRFDGIIPFQPLTEEQMKEIVKIKLNRLVQRLAEKQVHVTYTEELINALAQRGGDDRLGARPLQRLIQDKLEAKLARVLLERETDETIKIKLSADMLD